ncbi:MAG: ParA family protein [Gammaproteobacteria bacterium]|nr:MAG: ParA family protein [Gammaproteobacteria bacterium]
MARIIAVTNQKGGVGKTTTSVNLSASLAASRKKVLLVDLDPQGNATMGCGVDKHEVENTACELLLGEANIRETMVKVESGFSIVPTNTDLTAAEVAIMDMPQREQKLRYQLTIVKDEFDYIIIDCPPSLSMLTINALVAADGVLIPIQCEYYALEGLTSLLDTIEKVKAAANPNLEIEGLLRTMADPRNNLSNEVSAQLLKHFGKKVYTTMIPRNVRLAEAPSHGIPVMEYDRSSRGAVSYMALAAEIIRKAKMKSVAI